MTATAEIEDFYPLSPMQEGMLFHTLYETTPGVYVTQVTHVLHGKLYIGAFEQVWQRLVDHHAILRTFFIWEKLNRRVQVVQRQAKVRIEVQDWRNLTKIEQQERLREWLQRDRQQGFNLSRAPLVRFALMLLEENATQFVFTFHHLLLDGWSMPMLLEEALTLYEALQTGREVSLPPRRPYRDYISWLQQQDMRQAEVYWRRVLKGFKAPTPLPFDRVMLQGQVGQNFGEEELFLPPQTSTSLETFARRQRLTLNTLTQGIWALLLSRYGGETDVLFGAVVSGRPANLRGVESMVGLFINTLPVRVQVAPSALVPSWLKEFQEQQVEARQYEHASLVQIQGWSEVPRGVSLFESIFVFENYPLGGSVSQSRHGLEVSHSRCEEQSNYPLNIMVTPSRSGFSLKVFYDCSRFEAGSMKRMLGHYATLLEGVVKNPEQRISELPMLTSAERQQLTVEWNQTETPYPKDQCIHELFEQQVEQRPDQIAVVFENEHVSYGELNARANQLAHCLGSRGVGPKPEVLVGIMLERSVAMVVALLGVLKAGGAYVPLDSQYPAARLGYMLKDAGVKVLITKQQWLETFDREAVERIIYTNKAQKEIAKESEENVRGRASTENLAYVIYTSGSTGKPKGVMVQHRALCNMVRAQIEGFGIRSDSRVLQFASFSFDASVSEVFTALLSGATLYLGDRDSIMPGPALLQCLRENQITTVTLPPSVLAVIENKQLPALNVIIAAGESCALETVKRWRNGNDQRRFFNAYGPTEATVCSTFAELDSHRMTIGRPIANTEVYILDANLQPAPIGVYGELHVGGVGVARGYLNKPDLTAERFIPNPFDSASSDSNRLYKTGDLARWLPYGNIEFRGRTDNQFKIRGYRIEAGEIESVLNSHADVAASIVIAREDTEGDPRLAAYWVPKKSERGASSNLEKAKNGRIELWPSVAEFYVYDDLLYHAMTADERRNQSYRVAINREVKDKVVLDIGTGKDAILARFCVEAGAQRVYAIELLEESYKKAKVTIERLGLADKIILIHGNSMEVELPEKIDVCVSEIVGPVGGCEGAARIINNAWRFMKEDGLMIPTRSLTKLAAITLPENFLTNPCFTEVSAHYVEKVFEQIGHKFDLRLCLRNFSKANIISNHQTFEDLDFSQPVKAEFEHEIELSIDRDAQCVGFVVWLNLYTMEQEVIDILEHEYCWLPVYLPVFYPGIEVHEGDRIKGSVNGRLSDNNLNLDYMVKGQLVKRSGENIPFEYTSYHHQEIFQTTAFHKKIFPNGRINILEPEQPHVLSRKLREYLKEVLPEYMIPSLIIPLDALPLTTNGKIDHNALPGPLSLRPELETSYVPPQTEVEQRIAVLWQDILQIERIGVHQNFFDLGGHSLMMLQINGKLRAVFGREISLVEMFQYPTINSLSRFLTQIEAAPPSYEKIHDRAQRQKDAINKQKQVAIKRKSLGG